MQRKLSWRSRPSPGSEAPFSSSGCPGALVPGADEVSAAWELPGASEHRRLSELQEPEPASGPWGAGRTEGLAEGCGWMLQRSCAAERGRDSTVGVSAAFLVLHPSCLVQVQPRDPLFVHCEQLRGLGSLRRGSIFPFIMEPSFCGTSLALPCRSCSLCPQTPSSRELAPQGTL